MKAMEACVMGAEGLLLHKVRTLFTMLGSIIGVAAVVAMLSIGNGAKEEIRRQIEAYGADTLYVRARHLRGDALNSAREQGLVGLSRDDATALRKICSFITRMSSQALVQAKVRRLGETPKAQVVGVTPEYFDLTGTTMSEGRPFSAQDDQRYNRVAVLGPRIARQLFLNENPVGGSIRIEGMRFKVIGVTGRGTGKGAQGVAGGAQIKTRDVTTDVYIPLSIALSGFPQFKESEDSEKDPRYHQVKEIVVEIEDASMIRRARDVIDRILRRRHRSVEDFEIIIPLEILEQSRRTQEIFNLVMSLIAGLSLLVGGIGIMNIMMANVSERTREIGIRRAIGASRRDVEIQFLSEAVLISLFGGCLGILLGISIAKSISFTLGWETIITVGSVLLAFGISTVVGIVFGYYPAQMAARLDPIEALRHE